MRETFHNHPTPISVGNNIDRIMVDISSKYHQQADKTHPYETKISANKTKVMVKTSDNSKAERRTAGTVCQQFQVPGSQQQKGTLGFSGKVKAVKGVLNSASHVLCLRHIHCLSEY